MAPFVEKDRGGTDIAALSGGVVAVTVSVFTASGPFVPLNALFGVSLVLIILSYVWPHARTGLQTLAVGASLGLACIPIFGYLFEILHSWRSAEQVLSIIGDPQMAQSSLDKIESGVTQKDYIAIWIIGLLGFYVADSIFQRKISKKKSSTQKVLTEVELPLDLSAAVDDWAKSNIGEDTIRPIVIRELLSEHLKAKGYLK